MGKSKSENGSTALATPPEGRIQLPTLIPRDGALGPIAEAAGFLGQLEGQQKQPDSLPIVTIDHKAGAFKLPTGELVNTLRGYPVYYFQTRAFYAKAFQAGSSAPPDCWSPDMETPHPSSLDRQATSCYDCPKSQFGSARDGRSQACSAKTWVFLLNPEFGNPPIRALISPPSSIKAWLGTKFKAGFLAQARAQAGGAYQLAFCEVHLEPGGELFHVCVPKVVDVCRNKDEQAALAKAINAFRAGMDAVRGLTPNVGGDDQ
jgi:hypothetical protein